MSRSWLALTCSLVLVAVACADQTTGVPTAPPDATDASAAADADAIDAAAPDGVEPLTCTSTFGTAITPEFGRLDGTVRAVVVPGDRTCRSTPSHVIVQIDADGATYMAWINVSSTLTTDPDVSFATFTHDFVGPAWSSGWHPGTTLDYPTSLGVHSGPPFQAYDKATLAAKIVSTIPVGAEVSVYMTGFDTHDGGHKVHRDGHDDDGAVVVLGGATATYLLFHFADQTF